MEGIKRELNIFNISFQFTLGKSKKSKKAETDGEDGGDLDIPDGDDGIFSKRRQAAEQDSGPVKSVKSSQLKSTGTRKK